MMDKNNQEKDAEEGVVKDGNGEDITCEHREPIVKEAQVDYNVDVEKEYVKYLKLPEMTRAEFIDGKIIYLGEPSRKHQKLVLDLGTRFNIYLHKKTCEVYVAPFGVKIDFEFDPGSRNTLQPDLLVVCDEEKIDAREVKGAPDLVIEILSPSNLSHDKIVKYTKYFKAGVKEYWMVDPMKEEVNVNILTSNRYISTTYKKGDIIKVSILDDLYINVTDLFEGSTGDEIVEIEKAREEERQKADAEKVELLKKADADKLVNAKNMLEDGFSIEMIERYTGLTIEKIKQLQNL